MRKILFLDRDGVLINEPIDDPQIDSLDKVLFVPGLFTSLKRIVDACDYTLVMVTNQDGLGTESFPSSTFWPVQDFIIRTLEGEGIHFDEVHIDSSFPGDNSDRRKPGVGMLRKYMKGGYDLENSLVIGDRLSDMHLAKNLGCKGIRVNHRDPTSEDLADVVIFESTGWPDISSFITNLDRKSKLIRQTSETNISVGVNLDGNAYSQISTGLGFFDHMLEQIARHGNIDLEVITNGDLHIDEHHTIEDTALALGAAMKIALGRKAGIDRYGFALPMDEVDAQVLLDFGGRPYLQWQVEFTRDRIGDIPSEMWEHFFKSFSDSCQCNISIKATGENNHHIIEAIFKSFARALKGAITRKSNDFSIPSTKGVI